MKDIGAQIVGGLILVALIAVGAPAVIGLIDATCWFYTAHTTSLIRWDEAHVWFATVGGVVALCVSGALFA